LPDRINLIILLLLGHLTGGCQKMISGYAQTILKAREKFYMKERIQTKGSGIRKVKL